MSANWFVNSHVKLLTDNGTEAGNGVVVKNINSPFGKNLRYITVAWNYTVVPCCYDVDKTKTEYKSNGTHMVLI